jgi:hypothetical protein
MSTAFRVFLGSQSPVSIPRSSTPFGALVTKVDARVSVTSSAVSRGHERYCIHNVTLTSEDTDRHKLELMRLRNLF